jgi:hypothetical protein
MKKQAAGSPCLRGREAPTSLRRRRRRPKRRARRRAEGPGPSAIDAGSPSTARSDGATRGIITRMGRDAKGGLVSVENRARSRRDAPRPNLTGTATEHIRNESTYAAGQRRARRPRTGRVLAIFRTIDRSRSTPPNQEDEMTKKQKYTFGFADVSWGGPLNRAEATFAAGEAGLGDP